MSHSNDNTVSLIAPIVQVTLLEDRARVVRRGSVRLPAGTTVLRIDDVAPVAVDKTLLARALDNAAVSVADAQIRRRIVERTSDGGESGSAEELESVKEELSIEIRELSDQRTLLQRRVKSLETLVALSLEDLAEDVSWGGEVSRDWVGHLDELSQTEVGLRGDILAKKAELRKLHRKRDDLDLRLEALSTPARREWAGIDVTVVCEAGGEATLEVEYGVPGACWRPYHTARLEDDSGTIVHFSTDACVWQNTGEDWTDVELLLSTERLSLGTEPPTLESDVLAVRKKSAQVVVEAREQEVQTTGLGTGGRELSELPGIDDGGEEVHLRAKAAATVPSDGRPWRVRLMSFEAAAETDMIAMPELSPTVLLKSSQTNESSAPLLAGPVDLIRDSGLVGRTSILYVASGEQFELSWGPDAELRIKRTEETFREKSRMLSSWVSRQLKVEIHISNLGGAARELRVTERVPVSEIDKVKIEIDGGESSADTVADEQGFVTWTVALEPFDHATRVLCYAIKKHEDVVGI